MNIPKECIVDTNVPKIANLSTRPQHIPPELMGCVLSCIAALEHVVQQGGIVLDEGDEIYNEYRNQLSLSGEPGVGDRFLKWVHNNQWNWANENRVPITKSGDSYEEFPDHPGLTEFDLADKKFVAVSNAHGNKPAILQAADSKWWGWKDALKEAGIPVVFLCPQYIENKFKEKSEE